MSSSIYWLLRAQARAWSQAGNRAWTATHYSWFISPHTACGISEKIAQKEPRDTRRSQPTAMWPQHVSTVHVACAPCVSLRHFSQCTAILAFYDLPHVVESFAVCCLISWKIYHHLIKLLMMQSLSAYVLSTTMNGNCDQFACGNLFFSLVFFSLLHAALLNQHWKWKARTFHGSVATVTATVAATVAAIIQEGRR